MAMVDERLILLEFVYTVPSCNTNSKNIGMYKVMTVKPKKQANRYYF